MLLNIVSPRSILVGAGTVARLAEVLAAHGLSRPLVVTDPWMVSSGTVEKALAPLRAAGIAVAVFSDTVPDPTDTVVEAGVAVFSAGDYDSIVGFGGGSPMDTAKAIAILAAVGGHIRSQKAPHAADRAADSAARGDSAAHAADSAAHAAASAAALVLGSPVSSQSHKTCGSGLPTQYLSSACFAAMRANKHNSSVAS